MKRFLFFILTLSSFFAHGQDRFSSIPAGASTPQKWKQLQLADIPDLSSLYLTGVPSNFLRSNASNLFTGTTSFRGAGIYGLALGESDTKLSFLEANVGSGGWTVNSDGTLSLSAGSPQYNLNMNDSYIFLGYPTNGVGFLMTGTDNVAFGGASYSLSVNGTTGHATVNNENVTDNYGIDFANDPTGSTYFTDLSVPTKKYVDDLVAGAGGVTSVGLSLPSIFDVTNSPITSSGTLTGAFASQITGKFLKAPRPTGYQSTGTPDFFEIENTDIPFKHIRKYRLVGVPFLFGDSFFLGTGTTGGYSIVNQLTAKFKPITFNNLAVSGKGANVNAISAYANMPTYGNTNSVVAMFGFNDIGFGGGGPATLNKVANAYRAIAVNAWLKFATPASAITNTGTWSNFTSLTLKANNLSGNARQSSTSGNTLSYTTTETTDNVVIGVIGTDGSTYDYGRIGVTIDGVLMQTYNPNGQADGVSDGTSDNGRTPNVLVFTNLQNTTHTISLEVLDSKTTVVDYVGYLQRPNEAAPVFAVGVPRRDATGYAAGSATDQITTDLIAKIESVTIETWALGYPFPFINTDRTYDITTGLNTSDHIHANNSGAGMITNAIAYHVDDGHNIATNFRIAPGGTTGAFADLYANGNSFSIFHNTDKIANTKIDATRGTIILQSNVTSGSVGLNFLAGAAGADPNQKINISNTGKMTFSNSTDGAMLSFPTSSIGQVSGGNLHLTAGAEFNGSNYTLKTTSFTALNVSPASGLVGFMGTGTAGSTSSGTEFVRINNTVTRFPSNTLIGNNSGTPTSTLHVAQSALTTTNIIPAFRVAPGAHTGAASTTYADFDVNLTRNFAWATGTLNDQVFSKFGSPTMGFAGSSTANRATILYVGAPIAGTNATLANPLSINARGNIRTPGILLKEIAPAQITANTNNYNPGTGSNFQLTSDGSYDITGLANGYNGKVVILTNVGANNLSLTHEDTNSTAANRFSMSTEASIVVGPNRTLLIKYDSIASRWRDVSGSAMTDNLVATSVSASGLTVLGGSSILADVEASTLELSQGLIIDETNERMGIATLSGGTVVVNSSSVTANSRIFLTINGGTLTNVGTPYVSTRTVGTSFTITSTNASDVSDVAWVIIEPN